MLQHIEMNLGTCHHKHHLRLQAMSVQTQCQEIFAGILISSPQKSGLSFDSVQNSEVNYTQFSHTAHFGCQPEV